KLPSLLSGTDLVIHAGWDLKTNVAESPRTVVASNIEATARLLEEMRRVGSRRLFYVSSCAVYGDSQETSETSACAPVNINGITKLLNERMIESFCQRAGIAFTIFRIFNIFGGNDQFSVISKLRNAIESNGEFRLNNDGVSQRDFVHVDDVATIMLKV